MIKKFTYYLEQTFGIQLKLTPVPVPAEFPILYKAIFQLYEGILNGTSCLFAEDRLKKHLTPGQIQKHLSHLENHFQIPVVYVGPLPYPHETERLLARHIPLIVPDRYIHLPFIGTALDHRKRGVQLQRDYLSPCAQLIIIGVLLRQISQPVRIADLIEKLPYGQTSIVNAFEEIEQCNLGYKEKAPGSRTITLQFNSSGHDLWEKAQDYFQNPVKRTVGLEILPNHLPIVTAGADALAGLSMLSETSGTVFAMELSQFRKMHLPTIPARDAEITLQLWLYPPCIFGKERIDPLSLALSLKDHSDDRVQIALEKYIKEFKW